MKLAAFVSLVLLPLSSGAETWTLRSGRTFEAELAAADGLRATFTAEGKTPAVVPLADLTDQSRGVVAKWRADWFRPLVLPARLPAWPAEAKAPAGDPEILTSADGVHEYRTPRFLIRSDLKLPPYASADIARALEATRAALMAVPLGLHAGGERGRYEVRLFREAAYYAKAGGIAGSGGHYDPRRDVTLILLPNLGIEETEAGLRVDHARNLFILRHEITHHLLNRWHRHLPMWLNEGIAEFIASLPYSQGRYNLRNPSAGLKGYVLKWQPDRNLGAITLIPPARLMPMTRRDWDDAVKSLNAYDLYNSAGILACCLIQKDGGKPLAAYIDALRRGVNPKQAEGMFLLGGRPRDSLNAEVAAYCLKLGIMTGF
jgi:hypothetical protein